jgi:hypothetical protein
VNAAEPLVSFRRSGGREPSDDERLDVWPDGRFEARRTVGGRRIGRFAGELDEADLADLEGKAAAAAGAGDVNVATPMDGATVSVIVAGAELRAGSNEPLDGPWGDLVGGVKSLLDGPVLGAPVAGLELDATASQAVLRHIGDAPLEVDTASVAVRAVRLDAQGAVLGRWQGTAAPAQVEDAPRTAAATWVTADAGWELDLPFRHGLELTLDDRLQVWVTLQVRDASERRSARLFAAVSGAGG